MSEQIPNILVTLTVFNTSVAIYSNGLTKTKNMKLKSIKRFLKIKNMIKKYWKNKKYNKAFFYTFIKNI